VVHRGLVAAVIALVLGASQWLARQSSMAVELDEYNSYHCQTGAATGATFKVLTLTSAEAMPLADRLCRSPAMRRQVADVVVTWRPRGFLTAKDIVEEEYDYFWNRRHLVIGMVPDFDNYYRPLLDTPTYALYWIAIGWQPRISAAALAGKTLGFLQDPHSQTFFLQPFKALKEAGITLDESQKRFYPDMAALYRALTDGEVDLTTGTDRIIRELGIGAHHRLLLADDVSSGSWFLRNRWFGTGIECVVALLNGPDPFFAHQPTLATDELDCRAAP